MRLAHGWRLTLGDGVPEDLTPEFIRPAVRALPNAMARRIGPCHVTLVLALCDTEAASRWKRTERLTSVDVATGNTEAHDVAMELLTCLGQIVSDGITVGQREAYLWLLFNEIEAGVTGEIDEAALIEKRPLLNSGAPVGSPRKVAGYAAASLAGTVAEYVHCLWHDVAVREGPEFLPPEPLRKRLELLARWFPPNKGYSLFQVEPRCT